MCHHEVIKWFSQVCCSSTSCWNISSDYQQKQFFNSAVSAHFRSCSEKLRCSHHIVLLLNFSSDTLLQTARLCYQYIVSFLLVDFYEDTAIIPCFKTKVHRTFPSDCWLHSIRVNYRKQEQLGVKDPAWGWTGATCRLSIRLLKINLFSKNKRVKHWQRDMLSLNGNGEPR